MRAAVREIRRMAMAGLLALAALFVLAAPAEAHQGHRHAAPQASHAQARTAEAPPRDRPAAVSVQADCRFMAAAPILRSAGPADCPGHDGQGHEPGGDCCCGPAHCAGIGAAGLPLVLAALPSPAPAEPRPGLASAVPPGIGHAPDLRPPLTAA